MFVNPDFIKRKYKCNKIMADYLIYNKGFPVLSVQEKDYYFSDTPLLQEILQNLPLWLKIANYFKGMNVFRKEARIDKKNVICY